MSRPFLSPQPRQHLLAGDRVKFFGEKQAYTVQAVTEHYVALTKPFNLRHTVLYTIIGWNEGWRGPHNSWGFGMETAEECAAALESLEGRFKDHKGDRWKIELSQRRSLALDIQWVEREGKRIEPAIDDPNTIVLPLTALYDPATVVG